MPFLRFFGKFYKNCICVRSAILLYTPWLAEDTFAWDRYCNRASLIEFLNKAFGIPGAMETIAGKGAIILIIVQPFDCFYRVVKRIKCSADSIEHDVFYLKTL